MIQPVLAMFDGCPATEIIRGREYQTPLPVDVSLRTAEDKPSDSSMNATIISNQSMQSKYAFDSAKSVNGLIDASTVDQGPYDEFTQKSLLQMSI